MPSPFPGMNPYLESVSQWSEFHLRFAVCLSAAIGARLPERYQARIDKNVYIHELSAEERFRLGRPDVFLTGPSRSQSTTQIVRQTAPMHGGIPPGIEVEEVPFLEIRDLDGDRVVTTIEILSPCNKDGGADMDQYRAKVFRLLRTTANFIEIDLLRSGLRTPWNNLPSCHYCVVVSRAAERPQVGVWPFQLRDPMPVIPVPLDTSIDDIELNLKNVLDHAYDLGCYGQSLYRRPLQPPLPPADAAWAAEFLAAVPR